MRPITGGTCDVCGERLVSVHAVLGGPAESLCGLCRQEHPPFARALAYGTYDGGLRELIHLLKYEHVRPASNVLGRMLAEVIAGLETSFTGPMLLIPIPLHKRKLRERGFNQSEMIATAALKVHGGATISICSDLLQRRRETESQIGLTRNQRRENIRGAFAVTNRQALAGREVLLVDDVFTTGTTASECARVLLRAGATKVWVATVARTLKHNAALGNPELEESESVAMRAHA